MGLSAIKAAARLAIQERMGEPCTYSDGETATVPTLDHQAAGLGLTARFHTKAKVSLGDSDGLTLMENIEKLVFSQSELDALGLSLEHDAHIHFPGYGITVALDSPLDPDGPENVYWTVTRA
jgi:hypothetical protein